MSNYVEYDQEMMHSAKCAKKTHGLQNSHQSSPFALIRVCLIAHINFINFRFEMVTRATHYKNIAIAKSHGQVLPSIPVVQGYCGTKLN